MVQDKQQFDAHKNDKTRKSENLWRLNVETKYIVNGNQAVTVGMSRNDKKAPNC